jgi:proline dehydrogenase
MKPSSSKNRLAAIAAVTAVLLLLAYQFGAAWLRGLLLYLSAAAWAQKSVKKVPLARQVAGRFIAGETRADAVVTAQIAHQAGMSAAVNYLGEHVHDAATAVAATDEIAKLIAAVANAGELDAYVSVKPSQLGLQISDELLHSNLLRLVNTAKTHNMMVRIDMEESETVDRTLGVVGRIQEDAALAPHVGVVIQAYLYRSRADVEQLIAAGANVRLCKGAYKEPEHIAFADKTDTDQNFRTLAMMMLSPEARAKGFYPAFATHDEVLIEDIVTFARAHNIPPSAYEFQMLYGIRRNLQEALVQDGIRVRLYIPYGTAWYPYFVRRLAERPANLWFFLSNLIRH